MTDKVGTPVAQNNNHHGQSLLVVEDHPIVRDGLIKLLEKLGFTNSREAGTLSEAITLILGSPDSFGLVLLDLNLPDSHGLNSVSAIQTTAPSLPIVLITSDINQQTITQAFERGVAGFVPKSSTIQVIQAAISLVLAGGKYLPSELIGHPQHRLVKPTDNFLDIESVLESKGLTPRQIDISLQLLDGKSNKEIARATGLSPGTVKNHIAEILRRVNIATRARFIAELRQYATNAGNHESQLQL